MTAKVRLETPPRRPAGVPETVWQILACPMCEAWPLDEAAAGVSCTQCGARYPVTGQGQLDLRLRGPKTYPMAFTLGEDPTGQRWPALECLQASAAAELDYRGIDLPRRLTKGNRLTPELLSYFPYVEAGGALLDLGCGNHVFRQVAAYTNLEYVGVDYDGQTPSILADAHSLPFRAQSFDFVMSFAVLEHVQYPFVVVRELSRVMKPGARFVGTVAFLEPFHRNSFYHLTHLGTYNLLASGGLEVEHLEPNAGWSGLRAMAEMGLFPRMPKALARLLVLPVEALHELWWRLGHRLRGSRGSDDLARQALTTAGFRFVCRKP